MLDKADIQEYLLMAEKQHNDDSTAVEQNSNRNSNKLLSKLVGMTSGSAKSDSSNTSNDKPLSFAERFEAAKKKS